MHLLKAEQVSLAVFLIKTIVCSTVNNLSAVKKFRHISILRKILFKVKYKSVDLSWHCFCCLYSVVYLLDETIVVKEEEKIILLCKLQEKSLEVAQLKKQVDDLQKMVELPSKSRALFVDKRSSHEREELQVSRLGI